MLTLGPLNSSSKLAAGGVGVGAGVGVGVGDGLGVGVGVGVGVAVGLGVTVGVAVPDGVGDSDGLVFGLLLGLLLALAGGSAGCATPACPPPIPTVDGADDEDLEATACGALLQPTSATTAAITRNCRKGISLPLRVPKMTDRKLVPTIEERSRPGSSCSVVTIRIRIGQMTQLRLPESSAI